MPDHTMANIPTREANALHSGAAKAVAGDLPGGAQTLRPQRNARASLLVYARRTHERVDFNSMRFRYY